MENRYGIPLTFAMGCHRFGNMDITWADRIKALEEHGKSLTEIGRLIGKSPQAVSDIKQGRTREPGGMAAVRLHALYLGVGGQAADTQEVA